MSKKYNIVVIGATGAVGKVLLDLIEDRNFPYNSLHLCASSRSIGKKLVVNNTEFIVEEITEALFDNIDFVFISANNEISKSSFITHVRLRKIICCDIPIWNICWKYISQCRPYWITYKNIIHKIWIYSIKCSKE